MVEMASIERVGGNEYRITGMLNLKTINKLRLAADPIIDQESGPIRIDLSGTITKGVAGLALLSSLVRTARRSEKELVFVNPPSSLLTLVEANGLGRMLSLSSQSPTGKHSS